MKKDTMPHVAHFWKSLLDPPKRLRRIRSCADAGPV
jgi:hypothetical protein